MHAVTYAGGQTYTYDANGNQVASAAGTWYEYTRSWDTENRLIGIGGDGATAAFVYDGDSNRVKATIDGVTTAYVGSVYEVNPGSGVTTTYYHLNGQRVAMRTAAGVTYLAADHLGSASLAMGASNTSQRYYPYGHTRSGSVPTDYQFTGQKNDGAPCLVCLGRDRLECGHCR